MKIKKMLIANRGEIAVRVALAAKELGIKTVAVYSEADKESKFLNYTDEVYCIGKSAAAESYLNAKKLISIAKRAGCDAVHPCYGFLAENADFAESVLSNGLLWIGPKPSVMKAAGDKIEARKMAVKLGVPIIPGLNIDNDEDIRDVSDKIGFPVLVKAAAGGGGKGMHAANNLKELKTAVIMGKSEAKSSFGDDTVYIEKLLKNPRHIEIQLLLDQYGNGVYFPERECSIQRRYQKIIEETPSTAIDRKMAAKLGETALKFAKAIDYHTVGTAEFLVADGKFYFLEMNARIQVEHPITEAITGIDLVTNQIKLAAGDRLSFKQEDITVHGHSIEARIYAEDPLNHFAPSPGKIRYYKEPVMPGIRCDSGVNDRSEVSPYYDPMLSKLISYGENRKQAIDRLYNALSAYHIAPVKTDIQFLKSIINHPLFRKGIYDTRFIEKHLEELIREKGGNIYDAAAIFYLVKHRKRTISDNSIPLCWENLTGWRG